MSQQVDKSEKYHNAREAIGMRVGITYAALDTYVDITEEFGDVDDPLEQERVEVAKEMMNWCSLLLGVLYPEEMQDDGDPR